MKVTLDLPDELAADLRRFENHSASIVAEGLREVKTPSSGQHPGLAQQVRQNSPNCIL